MKNFMIEGFKLAGVSCGVKSDKNRKDLALIVSDKICSVAGVFTTNKIQAAPVIYSKKIIKSGKAQAIVASSGAANAGTGKQGLKDVEELVNYASEILKIPSRYILNASTGKIGVRLPLKKLKKGLKIAVRQLSPNSWNNAAQAIMTTDTTEKIILKEVNLKSGKVKIGAIAKGSGMISPELATMLVFILTDLKANFSTLQTLLKKAVSQSFNLLTIDNCMSTNDTVFLLANGLGKVNELKKGTEDFYKFEKVLIELCQELCQLIARDGEGATKIIEVVVKNCQNFLDGSILAKAVAGSNLVKTAVFGADPNWGRVLSALGASKVKINPNKIDIFFGNTKVFSKGLGTNFNREKVKRYLSQKVIKIKIDLHDGKNLVKAYGCDLTYDYVKINAEYN